MPKEEFSSLRLGQRKDHKLSKLIKYLEDEILPPDSKQYQKLVAQANSFTMINDVLYYIDIDPKQKYQLRAAVPIHLREKVMNSIHGGYFAGPRLYKVLVRSRWWAGMYKDSVNHCKSCPQAV